MFISCLILAIISSVLVNKALALNMRRLYIKECSNIKNNKQADKELTGRFRKTYQKIQGTANVAIKIDGLTGIILSVIMVTYMIYNISNINQRVTIVIVYSVFGLICAIHTIYKTSIDKYKIEILSDIVSLGREIRLEELKLGKDNQTLTKNDLTRINKECIKLYELVDKTKEPEQEKENCIKIRAKVEFIRGMKNDLVASSIN